MRREMGKKKAAGKIEIRSERVAGEEKNKCEGSGVDSWG